MMRELGRSTVGAYASAKRGLKMLTQNMATEWAGYYIQTNGIGPGYFATSQTAPISINGHPFNEFIIVRTPAGKWGDPSYLEGADMFLSSGASGSRTKSRHLYTCSFSTELRCRTTSFSPAKIGNLRLARSKNNMSSKCAVT